MNQVATAPTLCNVGVAPQRLYFLDNLRAIAMLLGIVLHACLPYSQNINLLFGDNNSWIGFDVSFWFIHMFRMGIFFVIAGYFAHLLLKKHGEQGLIKHRSKRVLLPFVLFLIATAPALIAIMLWANANVEHPGYVLKMLEADSGNNAKLSTGHLWFLYYLFLFCVVAALFTKTKLAIPSIANAWSFLLLPLLMLPAVTWQGNSINAPDGLLPQLWAFGFYGLYFLLGWQVFAAPTFFDLCHKYRWLLLAMGCLLFTCKWFYTQTFSISSDQAYALLSVSEKIQQQSMAIVLTSFCSCYLVFAGLGLGKGLLNWQTHLSEYFSRASYWVYLIHMLVLLCIQVALANLAIPLFIKFLLSISLTLTICLLSYKLWVQHTWLGRLLNG